VEGALRLAGYRPLPVRPTTQSGELLFQYTKFRSSPDLVWELVPGWSGREGNGTVTINAKGLRERDLPVAKPAGVRRILCLGDSVTFGHGVEAEEAYPRRLEEHLLAAGHGPIQVINSGVPGYSPFQERIWLDRSGWAYAPDLIVLGFVLNDVVERYLTMAAYGGTNTILGVDTTVGLAPWVRLARRTAFHRLVTSLMRAGEERREVYSVRRLFDDAMTAEVEAAWEIGEDELAGIAAAARQRGVPLLLVAFPFRFQVVENLPPRPQERLAAWARATDVPFLDLTPVFTAAGGKVAFLDQDHPTPAGHLSAARAIAAEIEARGWLR
jgi:lysophospholipase L1-like esterase